MFLRGSFSFCVIAIISVAFGQEPASRFSWNEQPRPVPVQKAEIPFVWDAAPAASVTSAAAELTAVSSSASTADLEYLFPQSTNSSQVEPRNKSLSRSELVSVNRQERETANKPKDELVQVRPSKTNTDNSSPMKGAFSTESYTAPLGTGEQLFAGLKISNSYQNAGGVRLEETQPDNFATAFTWASPVFAHRPLYFEQPNLERYGMGHKKCTQPIFSGIHFYGAVFLLPYKMLKQRPNEESYTLGHQRPGSYAAYQRGSILGL